MHRVVAGTKRGRQMASAKAPSRSRSKYQPHAGAKEIARAARFYMVEKFPSGAPLAAPIMVQHSSAKFF